MNLVEESVRNAEQKKKKRTTGIILAAIIILVIIIIGIASYLVYDQSTTLRVILDGKENVKVKQLLVFNDDGTIDVPIKEIASYLGYQSYNGSYNEKSEQANKCYVQNDNEVANFSLSSNQIDKLDLTKTDANYEIEKVKDPVKSNNGVLYASSEAIEKGFNVSFEYDKDANRVYIYTLPYLIQSYAGKVLDYGYKEISDVFANQKAILQNMLVVQKDENGVYAVLDTKGNAVLEPKYDNIEYLPETGDFQIESNKKVGIIGKDGKTKVQPYYDAIDLMDSASGLYLVQKDKKYGVIDIRGNTKIYIENDEIGLDISPFEQNNIKNKYILAGNLIPARKDKKWGLYNKTGKQVADYVYDSLGYITTSNKDALSLLVIPDYNVLVACKDKKYTLLSSLGKELFAGPVADDIYMTINGGQKHYYIAANNGTMDAETYLKNIGVSKVNNNISTGEETTINSTNNANTTNNNNNQNQTQQNSNNPNSEQQNSGEQQSDEQQSKDNNGEQESSENNGDQQNGGNE